MPASWDQTPTKPKHHFARKNAVVVLRFDNHYEIVGRLLEKHRIQREFKNTDEFILKFNPENLPRFPELSAYVPEEIKAKYSLKNVKEVKRSPMKSPEGS